MRVFLQVARRNGGMYEHPNNQLYSKIIDSSDQITDSIVALKEKNVSVNTHPNKRGKY